MDSIELEEVKGSRRRRRRRKRRRRKKRRRRRKGGERGLGKKDRQV